MISAIQTRNAPAFLRSSATPRTAPSPAAIVDISTAAAAPPQRPAESANVARHLLAQMTLERSRSGQGFTVGELLGRLRTQNLDALLSD